MVKKLYVKCLHDCIDDWIVSPQMPVLTAPLSDEVLNDSTSASFTCDIGRS